MCLPTLGWGAHIRALGLVVVVVVVMEVRRGWSDFDLFSWFLYHLVRSVSAGLSRTPGGNPTVVQLLRIHI